ncbi:glycosyltransferase family 4 protein [Bremerella cremea]|nr:glycosyltransferase family 1 protein [Bremerella cremea]
MRRLMIDITHTASHDYNTGIQRVARCLAREAVAFSERNDIECFPVVHVNGRFVHVDRWCAARGYRRYQIDFEALTNRVLPHWVNTSTRLRLNKLGTRLRKLLYPRTIDRKVRHLVRSFQASLEPANPGPGDVILMPDSWWDLPEMFDAVQHAQQNGALVGAMVHDLIPVRYPEFFTNHVQHNFCSWIERLIHTVDFMIGDAKAIADDLRSFVHEKNGPLADWQVRHVRLGCDLDAPQNTSELNIPADIAKLFANRDKAPYLMVSTLEIRKNHHYLLDAFDRLWAEGKDVSLVLVGKIGWKCDDLLKRIASHPEADKRLHLLNNVDDTMLSYIYEHSKAFVLTSKAEGFGLPIVEAAHHGLHVFASDIPIFREVAGPDSSFFSLDDPSELSQQISQFEATQGWRTAPPKQTLNEPWSVVFPKLVDTVGAIAKDIQQQRLQAARTAA